MGALGAALGVDRLVRADDRHRDGQLVGLLRARLGRLVVLGPGRERLFMPWLLGTALLHSAAVVEKRETLQRWTVLLAILTFGMSLIGTFLVRSGVLDFGPFLRGRPDTRRLHPGADRVGDRRRPGTLCASALPVSRSATGLPRSAARELVFNNLLLCAGMATVFLGTFYPLFAEVWSGVKLSVGPQFFDATFVPILAPGIVAMVIGPVLAWRRGKLTAALRRLAPAAVGAFLAPVIVFAFDNTAPAAALRRDRAGRSGPCSGC